MCLWLRARSHSAPPPSRERIFHKFCSARRPEGSTGLAATPVHSGFDPVPRRVCLPLVLLFCDVTRLCHKQVLLAVDPLWRQPEEQAAQFLASSPAVGRRFVAIKGDLARMAAQLSSSFPSLLCDLLVFIPDLGVPEAKSEAEEKLRDLILCAGTLTRLRGAEKSPAQDEDEGGAQGGGGDAERDLRLGDRRRKQETSWTRLFVLDGWPCRHARSLLVSYLFFIRVPLCVSVCVRALAFIFNTRARATVHARVPCKFAKLCITVTRTRAGARG